MGFTNTVWTNCTIKIDTDPDNLFFIAYREITIVLAIMCYRNLLSYLLRYILSATFSMRLLYVESRTLDSIVINRYDMSRHKDQ